MNNKNIEAINHFSKGTMLEHLGIVVTEVGDDFLKGEMPIDERHIQPFGFLHGGASVVLAESLGSIASNLKIDGERFAAFGLEVNANHIKAIRKGARIFGTAKAIHLGKSTHVWEISIRDNENNLVAISRLTMAIVEKSKK